MPWCYVFVKICKYRFFSLKIKWIVSIFISNPCLFPTHLCTSPLAINSYLSENNLVIYLFPSIYLFFYSPQQISSHCICFIYCTIDFSEVRAKTLWNVPELIHWPYSDSRTPFFKEELRGIERCKGATGVSRIFINNLFKDSVKGGRTVLSMDVRGKRSCSLKSPCTISEVISTDLSNSRHREGYIYHLDKTLALLEWEGWVFQVVEWDIVMVPCTRASLAILKWVMCEWDLCLVEVWEPNTAVFSELVRQALP